MRILTYCDVDGSDMAQRLGTPDYSYHFVLESFRGALEKFGEVQRIVNPQLEADALWQQSQALGEPCLLLSFAPPHKTPLGLQCPTIPVFAWEYPNLPAGADERSWRTDPRNDWRSVLLQTGAAITLSSHTVDAVRECLGPDYPITAVAAPLWEKFQAQRELGMLPPQRDGVTLCITTRMVDSRLLGLSAEGLVDPETEDATPSNPLADALLPTLPAWREDAWLNGLAHRPASSPAAPGEGEVEGDVDGRPPIDAGWRVPPAFKVCTRLDGVVYTAVLTPSDGRKNWEGIITAFGWAFRDVEDATLVLKLGGPDQIKHHRQMLMLLTKLSPMKCRVIAMHGYLEDADYLQLIGATTYYVNASLCEGLCLPLLEFLCCGVPAIAPDHTSMADYIHPDFAFVVDSSPGLPALWPHGDHQAYRTSRHQLDWHSLMLCYRRSYLVARTDPHAYAAMSASALRHMQAYCAMDDAVARLQRALVARAQQQPVATGFAGAPAAS